MQLFEADPRARLERALAVATPEEELEWVPSRRASLWGDALRRLVRNRLAMFGLVIILLFSFLAVFAPIIAPHDYAEQFWDHIAEYPSWQFPLGTDLNGRDVLSRMIYGARVSMTVGLVAQFIVVLIGVPIGAIAGYYGGKVDTAIMRFVDIMYAFPTLLFVILIMTMLGKGLFNIFIAIGLVGWVTLSRLVRAQVLALREKEFVKAARTMGASTGRILLRHILPNALTPIIVAVTFGIPQLLGLGLLGLLGRGAGVAAGGRGRRNHRQELSPTEPNSLKALGQKLKLLLIFPPAKNIRHLACLLSREFGSPYRSFWHDNS